MSIHSTLVPRLPPDFLEPGDVPLDGDEEEFETEDVEITEETAKELTVLVQQHVR